MKNPKLLASVAAVLITSATLSAVSKNYTADFQQGRTAVINGSKVTNLPSVSVHPTAAEWRAASLLTDARIVGMAGSPNFGQSSIVGESSQFSLIGSQLAMPYYSFSNKFGRISKE